jgi:hypothetical protein
MREARPTPLKTLTSLAKSLPVKSLATRGFFVAGGQPLNTQTLLLPDARDVN